MAKTIAVDFDGVIHKYSEGWKDGTIYDETFEGWDKFISDRLSDGDNVFILSSRNPNQIKSWFVREFKDKVDFNVVVIPDDEEFWNSDDVGVTNKKLPADVYIDDRCIKFDGWENMNDNVDNFSESSSLKEFVNNYKKGDDV